MTAEAPWQCKLEFNTDKMDDVNKVLISEMQVEQNSLSFFQPSVRSVTIALGIFAGLATLVELR